MRLHSNGKRPQRAERGTAILQMLYPPACGRLSLARLFNPRTTVHRAVATATRAFTLRYFFGDVFGDGGAAGLGAFAGAAAAGVAAGLASISSTSKIRVELAPRSGLTDLSP